MLYEIYKGEDLIYEKPEISEIEHYIPPYYKEPDQDEFLIELKNDGSLQRIVFPNEKKRDYVIIPEYVHGHRVDFLDKLFYVDFREFSSRYVGAQDIKGIATRHRVDFHNRAIHGTRNITELIYTRIGDIRDPRNIWNFGYTAKLSNIYFESSKIYGNCLSLFNDIRVDKLDLSTTSLAKHPDYYLNVSYILANIDLDILDIRNWDFTLADEYENFMVGSKFGTIYVKDGKNYDLITDPSISGINMSDIGEIIVVN